MVEHLLHRPEGSTPMENATTLGGRNSAISRPLASCAARSESPLGQKPAFDLSLIARGSEAVGGVARTLPWTPPFRFVGLGTKGS